MKKANRFFGLLVALLVVVTMLATTIMADEEDPIYFAPVQISGGRIFGIALYADGTVWGWGHNRHGQLGDGNDEFTMDIPICKTPVQAIGLNDVIKVSTGYVHSLALKSDGTVWVWGQNAYGQLGIETHGHLVIPAKVGLENIVDIAAGTSESTFNLALKSDGTVWSWGYNTYGQLGDGTNDNRLSPWQEPGKVQNLDDVVSISAGDGHSLALKSDGTVWAWGLQGGEGRLGNGILGSSNVPVQAVGLTDIVAISAGTEHNLALKSDGTVWAWGNNGGGRLGDGTTTTRTTPVQVSGLSDVVDVQASNRHSIALKSDGTVWVWGSNQNGRGGLGFETYFVTPVQNEEFSDAIAVSTGRDCSYVITKDGTGWAFGVNDSYQLGDMTSIDRNVPVQMFAGSTRVPPGSSSAALYVLLEEAETAQLSLTYNLVDNINYTWTSSDNGVATVGPGGMITAVVPGTCSVTATDGTFSESIPVKVISAEEAKLALHLTPAQSKRLWIADDPSAAVWASNMDTIATVNSQGLVTGVSQGLCEIIATVGSQTYSIYVRVGI